MITSAVLAKASLGNAHLCAHVNWQCDLDIVCYDDLLAVGIFNIEVYERIMFIRLFKGADLQCQIIYRRISDKVTAIREGLVHVG